MTNSYLFLDKTLLAFAFFFLNNWCSYTLPCLQVSLILSFLSTLFLTLHCWLEDIFKVESRFMFESYLFLWNPSNLWRINFFSYLLFHGDLSRMMVLHSHGEVEPDVRTIEGSLRKASTRACFGILNVNWLRMSFSVVFMLCFILIHVFHTVLWWILFQRRHAPSV